MKKALWIAIVGVAASGCVSTSDIVPMGKDSYLITGRASGSLYAGEGAVAATKRANAYCENQHKRMIVRRLDTQGDAEWKPQTTTFIFSCVDENDPEYKRPDLRKDPSTIIEDQRQQKKDK